jgi:hypothetical protein
MHLSPLAQAPLYSDKAMLFPDSTFAIGYDTAERLVAPRYYGGNDGMLLSMAALHGARCRVLVAGRVQGASSQADGEAGDASTDKFLTLADLEMPPDLRELVRFRSAGGFSSCGLEPAADVQQRVGFDRRDAVSDNAAQGLFRDIPEADFRLDISSTQLRAAADGAGSQ